MSVWEYASIFVSIILGLAAADLLISFHRLLRVDSRVQWYWLVPVLAAYAMLVIVDFWWATFHWFAQVRSLAMIEFLPTLLAAIALFLLTAAVLPDEVPQAGLDLKDWYLRNTRQIWILATIALSLVIIVSARGGFDSAQAAWDFVKSEWDNWILLAAFVWMIFTKRLRVHEVCIVLALIDMVYSAVGFRIG